MYILLHVLLAVYSLGGIFSKLAAAYERFNIEFMFCYSVIIMILGIYAFCWQQIIKRLPLTVAFANKAVTVVWGIIWGCVFFNEKITTGKITGAFVVMIGIVLFVNSEKTKGSGGGQE